MILAKKESQLGRVRSRLIPFELSRIQLDMQDKAAKRNITLKPRQIGSTTWHIICRLFLPAILQPGTSGLLISQTKGYGAQHFRILQRALKNFARSPLALGKLGNTPGAQLADDLAANLLHTQFSARHEIVFDFLDSKVLVETAENPDAGSGLTIQHLVACLHPDTWIQKYDGSLIKMGSLKKGDVLIGSEGTPVSVNWSGVIKGENHPYKGRAVRVSLNKNRGFETICSPNHQFLTQKGLVEAKDLTLDDYVLYPVKKFSASLKQLPVPQIGKRSWIRGKGKGRLHRKECFFKPPESIVLDKEAGFACGLYLAEGVASKKFPNRFSYCLHGKDEAYLAKRAYKRLQNFVTTFVVERGERFMV